MTDKKQEQDAYHRACLRELLFAEECNQLKKENTKLEKERNEALLRESGLVEGNEQLREALQRIFDCDIDVESPMGMSQHCVQMKIYAHEALSPQTKKEG